MYGFLSKLYDNICISKNVDASSFIDKQEYINFNTISKENYNIIPNFIRQHIESLNKTGRIYSFQLNGRNIKLYIILPVYSKKPKTIDLIKLRRYNNRKTRKIKNVDSDFYHYYKIVFSILHFFIGQHPNPNIECSIDLSIYLYLTNLKKILPNEGTDLNDSNVNTGFTFGCSLKNDIYIFRKEEWSKVFIHEVIHAFGLDFASHDELNSVVNRKMLKFFGINDEKNIHDLRIYEAYTETWATVLNTLFKVNSPKQIPFALQRQQIWSLNQYIKIMNHYKLVSLSAIENERQLILKERITLYSYYILKCRLLLNIESFFKEAVYLKEKKTTIYTKLRNNYYLEDINLDKISISNPFEIINFIKTKNSINRFVDFIQKNVYKDIKYDFHYFSKKLQRKKTDKTSFSFIKEKLNNIYGINSLRMTV